MPATPPFPFKEAPNPEVPPLPQVQVVRQPEMFLTFSPAGGDPCANATLNLDQMPLMNRDPQAIPDVPGGGYSYLGQGLEYLDMGVAPANIIPRVWSGQGAENWQVFVDGVLVTEINGVFDGTVGPFSVFLGSGFDWSLTHTFQLVSTYHDRPAYLDFYIDPTSIGVIAFGPCGAGPSILWNEAGYWDQWVIEHHDVSHLSGPVDRNGSYLGLTGPWGSDVPQQHIRSDDDPPCQDAYACTLLDFVCQVEYDEVTYSVESAPVPLRPCLPAGHPIFRHRHKASDGGSGSTGAFSGDVTRHHFQQTTGFKADH